MQARVVHLVECRRDDEPSEDRAESGRERKIGVREEFDDEGIRILVVTAAAR